MKPSLIEADQPSVQLEYTQDLKGGVAIYLFLIGKKTTPSTSLEHLPHLLLEPQLGQNGTIHRRDRPNHFVVKRANHSRKLYLSECKRKGNRRGRSLLNSTVPKVDVSGLFLFLGLEATLFALTML